MIDQFLLYDQAVTTWLYNSLAPLLVGRTTQVLVATARKAFADVSTGKLIDNRTLTTPRISVQRLSHENDPNRFNAAPLRRLGFCNPPDGDVQKRIRRGRYPAPTNFNYQVDLWTRFISEMNLWEQQILYSFSPQYIYLSIKPDDVYGDKKYIVFLDGGIQDSSELEPGEGDRSIRKTFNLRAEAWIFDQALIANKIAKRFELIWTDLCDDSQLEIQMLPPVEVIGTGDNAETTFNHTLVRSPVLPHGFVLQTVIGSQTEIVYDDGNGNLVGDLVASGTVDYTTGAISVTFTVAVDNNEDLAVTYFTDIE